MSGRPPVGSSRGDTLLPRRTRGAGGCSPATRRGGTQTPRALASGSRTRAHPGPGRAGPSPTRRTSRSAKRGQSASRRASDCPPSKGLATGPRCPAGLRGTPPVAPGPQDGTARANPCTGRTPRWLRGRAGRAPSCPEFARRARSDTRRRAARGPSGAWRRGRSGGCRGRGSRCGRSPRDGRGGWPARRSTRHRSRRTWPCRCSGAGAAHGGLAPGRRAGSGPGVRLEGPRRAGRTGEDGSICPRICSRASAESARSPAESPRLPLVFRSSPLSPADHPSGRCLRGARGGSHAAASRQREHRQIEAGTSADAGPHLTSPWSSRGHVVEVHAKGIDVVRNRDGHVHEGDIGP